MVLIFRGLSWFGRSVSYLAPGVHMVTLKNKYNNIKNGEPLLGR